MWEHVVLTDPVVGLTNDDVDDAIKILNGDLSTYEHTRLEDWGYHR